jgi:ADP-ribosylation factor related protein 1
MDNQKSMSLQKIPPTIGLNIAKIDKSNAEYTFWDVGGQAVLRKIWNKYFTECNGIVFLIDGSDEIRF